MKTYLQLIQVLLCIIYPNTWQATAQPRIINFKNIPETYTPVDDFGSLFAGVTLSSDNQLGGADAVYPIKKPN